MDVTLVRAWERLGLASRTDLALVAVGGYGRGELHPGSDVDLLVLVDGEPDTDTGERIQAFLVFLWDVGLEPGHSVRTCAQCVEEAERDITVATNLMEARLLSGPEALHARMREMTGPESVWPSRRFFEAKWEEQQRRHHKFGDTAYNLEPNVKEGPGGLRDIQMVGWVVKRHFGAATLRELVSLGFLTESEHQSLSEGQRFLWQVRFALHLLAGRREERLVFDHQPAVAKEFGYRDQDHNLAVEQFMKRYYRTVMELDRLNEMLLELFQEVILLAGAPADVVPVNKRFQARSGFLEASDERVFKRHPFALLELFLVMQQHPELKGVRATTIRLVREHRYLIDDAFRADLRARSLFLEILRQPRGLFHELRRMHRYGVLGAYLPEVGAVEGQMQYDLFHVYTVDEHSLFVVRNLRAFADPEREHELPLCSEVFARLPKPELLYVAGLFHDIAKGRGGDHSELGARDALEFCLRHGLGQYDARLVAWLVRNHLLMSVTAQRRDIHDPAVINEFAAAVGDQTHLDYLYLLTVADIRATNPNLWNGWKDSLLKDLYASTERVLRRGFDNPIDTEELVAETQAAARALLGADAGRGGVGTGEVTAFWRNLGDEYFLRSTPDQIAWHTRAILATPQEALPLVLARDGRGGTEIFVYIPDQEFLVAATTAALDRLGLNILNAQIITAENGRTLDSYVVLDDAGRPVGDAGRRREIARALRAALRTPRASATPAHRLARRQLRHLPVANEVNLFQDERHDRTTMEVISADRPGLLARIAWAIAVEGVRLQNAKIATFGERAEDVFFLTDEADHAVDEARWPALRAAVLGALEGNGPASGQGAAQAPG